MSELTLAYYLPTPSETLLNFVRLADFQNNVYRNVLECSAGEGALCDVLRFHTTAEIECVEINPLYCNILAHKGYKTYCIDFLKFVPQKKYDLWLMNPPYSTPYDKYAYCTHIEYAISILPKGTTLIASFPVSQEDTLHPKEDRLHQIINHLIQRRKGSLVSFSVADYRNLGVKSVYMIKIKL